MIELYSDPGEEAIKPSTMGEKIGFFRTLVYGIYGKIIFLV